MQLKETVNKFLISFGIAATLLVMPFASSVQAGAVVKNSSPSATVAQNQQQRMDNLKSRADNEISRRVSALTNLIARINQMKHLSTSNRTAFVNSINTQINSLNTLKTKIDTDTELATLKADVQSIVDSYRIFVVYMPQIQLLAAADRMDESILKLTDLATKLQSRLTTTAAVGNDVTSLLVTLKDMTSKIADATSQYNNVESSVIPLTPSGYPGNKSTLTSARKMIQTGHQDLVTALQDAKTIIQGLKALAPKTSTSSATQ